MKKPLFIAIGVHKAQGMQVLDGVIKGIDDLTSWARNCGYDVINIDDRKEKKEKVDISRIQNCLTPFEGDERSYAILLERPRIVVYFCGHGLHAPQDQYWILSAGSNQPKERISAVGFRDTLATYGPKQIAIISDACRSPLAVIGQGDCVVNAYEADVRPPQKDMFFSSCDGAASFAVPAQNGIPSYCVFSETLYRALSKPDGDNLDKLYFQLGRKVVTSQSLANYLENQVPETALSVGKFQTPQCDTGFRPVKNDYIEFLGDFSPVDPKSHGDDPKFRGNDMPINPLPEIDPKIFENFFTETSQARQVERINNSRSEWRAPFVEEVQDFIRSSIRPFYDEFGPVLVVSDQWSILVGQHTYESHDGWLRPLSFRERSMGQWFWKPVGFFETNRSNVLIAKSEDLYSPIPVFKDLWCSLIFNHILDQKDDSNAKGGIDLLAWGEYLVERFSNVERVSRGELHATEALKGLSAGILNSDDIRLFTQNMRICKHADPMLGIVSAYLYNGIGDIDNIRRMCYYYYHHQQDVPFDIAMLAGVPFERDGKNGCFVITVPEVQEIPKAHRAENAPEFTWRGTPSVNVNVAGVTPILRVGWQHIRNSKHRIHKQCWELVDDLTEAPISTFAGVETGETLIKIFKEFRL